LSLLRTTFDWLSSCEKWAKSRILLCTIQPGFCACYLTSEIWKIWISIPVS
jgi:hypothetical protein